MFLMAIGIRGTLGFADYEGGFRYRFTFLLYY